MHTQKIADEVYNQNWRALIHEFQAIEGKPKAKDLYEALKEKAKITILTGRQLEGIVARCDNSIKGEFYSRSTTPEAGKAQRAA